jgi:hypothetical protein
MLETLLQIGKTLRDAGRLKHHRYIKPAPLSTDKAPVIYLSVPVNQDFEFDLDNVSEITDENIQRNKLMALNYKSSEADTLVKYIFGDILFGIDKKGNETGYYRMQNEKTNAFGDSSFVRGREDAKVFNGTAIEKFRKTFQEHLDHIEGLLKARGHGRQVFLHFDFAGRHWYEFEPELEAINKKLLDDFLEEQNGVFVLRKFIYKTLAAGASQAPGFENRNAYKTKLFKSREEVLDLLYALTFSKKALINVRNIKIVVLPRGDYVKPDDIEDFFGRTGIESIAGPEESLAVMNQPAKSWAQQESLLGPILENASENITQFDLVFSKKGGSASTPDVDMIELSGLKRSFLAEINRRILEIREPLRRERNAKYPKRPPQFARLDILKSFLNILGDVTTDKKKYQNHLFKVLPQIYSGTYYQDAVLLPAFIEKTEFNIRQSNSDYDLLKYDYYFLTRLLNTNGENPMDEKLALKNYRVGLLLGEISHPLKEKIASFERSYVGQLSRRIADRQGLVQFANFVNEKLAIHKEASDELRKVSVELAGAINSLKDSEYRKNDCAFGFFESYFNRTQNTPAAGPLPKLGTQAPAVPTQEGESEDGQ